MDCHRPGAGGGTRRSPLAGEPGRGGDGGRLCPAGSV